MSECQVGKCNTEKVEYVTVLAHVHLHLLLHISSLDSGIPIGTANIIDIVP
jgi:hypothetical protein